ncbi:MAG: hypothetical protein JW956_11680 [Calditrichaceae bacterium]|nr:hypothetical protein [Calditrichaceae bacterium]
MKKFIIIVLIIIPTLAFSQLIGIKSVPLATGDQFNLYPALNYGMAGLTIAVDDSLNDAFHNPAKGDFITNGNIFTLPYFYTITNDLGSAQNFPIGFNYSNGTWFSGGAFSLQQLKRSDDNNSLVDLDDSNTNLYLHGFLGKKLETSGTAIGIGISVAKLKGVDGVDLLYANSTNVEQSGEVIDGRIGIFKEFSKGQHFEIMGLYHYLNMRHDVSYRNWIWVDDLMHDAIQENVVRNEDKSETYGVHLGYTHPLGSHGWRVGAIVTGNWKSHPKLPNYELQNIPRDPGDTDAYNIGFGISNEKTSGVFGFDVIYEPIWSHTWADAGEPVTSASGRIINSGEVTVDNDFEFSNIIMRFGLKKNNNKKASFQFGVQARAISYELDQYNFIEERQRDLIEDWVEFTVAWGWIINFTDFKFLYQGSLLAGAGRPGVANNFGIMPASDTSADYIVAPSGSLTLEDAYVFTHRFTFLIPLD